jgi:hypothetical protein
MQQPTQSTENEPMTVFRPSRRCARCGLVNAQSAVRCRRCHAQLEAVDRAGESERIVRRLRLRRNLSVALALVIAVGIAAAGYAIYDRDATRARFDENARRVEVDLVALELGVAADARAIANAFDEGEARRALDDQGGVWSYRSRRASEIAAACDDLVPSTPEQTRRLLDFERRIALVAGESQTIAAAATARDLDAARAAASRLLAAPSGVATP